MTWQPWKSTDTPGAEEWAAFSVNDLWFLGTGVVTAYIPRSEPEPSEKHERQRRAHEHLR